MAKLTLGKVAFTLGGTYDPTKSYDKLVCVTHNGRSWVSRTDVPVGIEPEEKAHRFWQLISERGETGPQGPQGEQGIQGPQGIQGNSGYSGAADELEVVNNLISDDATAALSAQMGKNIGDKLAQLDQDWNALKEQIQDAVLKVEVAPHIEVVAVSGGAAILQPDKIYDFGEVANLAIGFEAPIEGNAANYAFQFKSPASAPTTITMPDSVVFPVESDSMFNVKAGRTYQVTILNNLASASSWEV